MPQVWRTPESENDLEAIVRYIAGDNLTAALRWLDGIEALFRLLSTQPKMGERFRRTQGGEVRRRTFGEYVIYYRPGNDGIEVLRVLHGARDHERLV